MQLGGQGGLLDTVLQVALPAYGLMRNVSAFANPQEYGKGTMVGMFTNNGQSPASFSNFGRNVGNNLGFGDGGWFGNNNMYGSGYVGNSQGGLGGNSGWFGTGYGGLDPTSMALSETNAYGGYDTPSWTGAGLDSWDEANSDYGSYGGDYGGDTGFGGGYGSDEDDGETD